jgi:hypothetical protein
MLRLPSFITTLIRELLQQRFEAAAKKKVKK